MTARDVHWHEGMFLRPQHFQAGRGHLLHQMGVGQKWGQHYNWGLRAIEIDLEALANHRLVVRRLQARLHDGTLISVPPDGPLPALDLKPVMERDRNITVLIAVPALREGKANVGSGADSGARYQVDTVDVEDENTGASPQVVHVRRLNLKLLLSTQDQTGYEVLPLAKIQRSDAAGGRPELDLKYIPPVLACDAWKELAVGVLQQGVYDRIGQKLDFLAKQVEIRSIAFGSQAAGDSLILGQLSTLNEAYALFHVLAFADGVHPLPAYLEMCRLVGQLAIFGDEYKRRTPRDLPTYDHDDLARFFTVLHYFNELIKKIVEPDYDEKAFEGVGLRMEVGLEKDWLEKGQMFVGVRSSVDANECVRLLTRGGLEMKIGSSERVDELIRKGLLGLKFAHCPVPPGALQPLGRVYFQIDRDAQQEEWQHVHNSKTLAVRLNEQRQGGNIQGQKVLNIKTGAQTTTMQFTLFVVRG